MALLSWLPETSARWSLIALTFIGSVVAGLGLGVPVRKLEKRKAPFRVRMFTIYAPLFGFYATACGIAGLTALDYGTWSMRAMIAFLSGSMAGVALAFFAKPDPGAREGLAPEVDRVGSAVSS